MFDAVTSGWGVWTAVTAIAYGVLGAGSCLFFKNREATVKNFLSFGIVGTIFYDAVTGLTIGPIFQGQPFIVALSGQIPFTLMHLLGTVVFATLLSPALYKWVVKSETLELSVILPKFAKMGIKW